MLPDQLERNLNLAGRRLCGSDKPRTRYGMAALIESCKVIGGRGEVSAIQYIEKLRSKLNVETFRDTFYIVVLENREVEFFQPWSDQGVAAKIAE